MDPRTNGAWNHLRTGERRRRRRSGRSLLGRTLLSEVRSARSGHAQAGGRVVAGNLRLRQVPGAVLYPRRTDCSAQGELTLAVKQREEFSDQWKLLPANFPAGKEFDTADAVPFHLSCNHP